MEQLIKKVKRKKKVSRIIATGCYFVGMALIAFYNIDKFYYLLGFEELNSPSTVSDGNGLFNILSELQVTLSGIAFIIIGLIFRFKTKLKIIIKRIFRRERLVKTRHLSKHRTKKITN